jgi:hypothetical protein
MPDIYDDEFEGESGIAAPWAHLATGLTVQYAEPVEVRFSVDGEVWVSVPPLTPIPPGIRFVRYGDRITKISR